MTENSELTNQQIRLCNTNNARFCRLFKLGSIRTLNVLDPTESWCRTEHKVQSFLLHRSILSLLFRSVSQVTCTTPILQFASDRQSSFSARLDGAVNETSPAASCPV